VEIGVFAQGMQPPSSTSEGLRIAVTGASGNLGRLILPRLEADPAVSKLWALDIRRPLSSSSKLSYRRVDLVRHEAEKELGALLREEKIDVLYHLAFHLGRGRGSLAHELEVMGTLQILSAVAAAQVARLIVPSSTALYGARGEHPAWMDETTPLSGCPDSRFVQDKVRVEEQLRSFRKSHPETKVIVLRMAPVVGPDCDNPFTRYLEGTHIPTLLGFDPLLQVVHQDDAAAALHLALHADVQGEFNIVGEGVISLSGLVRQAGKRSLPLPQPMAHTAVRALNLSGASALPPSMLSYLHYSWIADGTRAAQQLGFRARHHVKDAVRTLKRG
jgi:UDP-glucose 4-epimerase